MLPRKFAIKCGNVAVLVDLHLLPLGGQEDASWFTMEHTKEVVALVRDAVDQRVRQHAESFHTRGRAKQRKEPPPGKALCLRGKSFNLVGSFARRHFHLRCVVQQQYGELRVFPERYVVCVSRPDDASAPRGNPSPAAPESNEQSRSEYFSRVGETQEPLNSAAKTKRAALQKIARLAGGQRKMCGSGPEEQHPDKRPDTEDQRQKSGPEEAGPGLSETASTPGEPVSIPGEPVSIRREPVSTPGEPVSIRGEPVSIRGESAPSLGKSRSNAGEKVPLQEEVPQGNPLPCPNPVAEPGAHTESMVRSGRTLGQQTENGDPDGSKLSETSTALSLSNLIQRTSRSKRPSPPEEDPLLQRAKRPKRPSPLEDKPLLQRAKRPSPREVDTQRAKRPSPPEVDPILRGAKRPSPPEVDPILRGAKRPKRPKGPSPPEEDPLLQRAKRPSPPEVDPILRGAKRPSPPEVDPILRGAKRPKRPKGPSPLEEDPLPQMAKRHKPSPLEEDPLPQGAKRACPGAPPAPIASELTTQTHPVERPSQTSKRDPLPTPPLPLVRPEAKAESKAFPAPESDKTTLEVELLTAGKRAQRLPLTSNNTEQTNQNRLAASLRGLSVKPASSGSSISSRSAVGEEGSETVPRTSRLRRQKRS